jgi:aminocarboxymuconate-semialdehyde decarboxylase
MTKIDFHTHVLPERVLGGAGSYGPEITIDKSGGKLRVGDVVKTINTVEGQRLGLSQQVIAERFVQQFSDPTVRIAEMDSKGIDAMVVTVHSRTYLYWAESEIAVPFAQLQNESMAEYCAHAPDRLFFLATLPLQDIAASAHEAERAILKLGARGINVGAINLGGHELDDDSLWPVYECIERLHVPLFIHPYASEFSGAASSHYSGGLLDLPYQETVAFTNLIYGGVLDEFPDLKIYLPHGGGFVPYQYGRIETFAGIRKNVKAKRPVGDYLDNFYYDVLIHQRAARQYLVDWAGADHLVVGSNYGGDDSVDGFAFVHELGLPRVDEEKIFWRNAAKLLNITEPTGWRNSPEGVDVEARTSDWRDNT